jgi:hypothetical protein
MATVCGMVSPLSGNFFYPALNQCRPTIKSVNHWSKCPRRQPQQVTISGVVCSAPAKPPSSSRWLTRWLWVVLYIHFIGHICHDADSVDSDALWSRVEEKRAQRIEVETILNSLWSVQIFRKFTSMARMPFCVMAYICMYVCPMVYKSGEFVYVIIFYVVRRVAAN